MLLELLLKLLNLAILFRHDLVGLADNLFDLQAVARAVHIGTVVAVLKLGKQAAFFGAS